MLSTMLKMFTKFRLHLKNLTMTTQEIANRLVELSKQNKDEQARAELFADDAESIEPAGAQMPYAKGLDNLQEKGRQFQSMIQEVHSAYVNEPQVAGNFFSLTMGMDVTFKDGNRVPMDEVCLYEVKDGKVVKEQFFY